MRLWESCRPLLTPALEDADETELLAALATGKAQLWAGERAAMVTQVTVDGACHVWLAGGELDEILRLRPGIEAWARGMGCTSATIEGRRGWRRVLRPFGFRPNGDRLRKMLS